MEGNKKSTKNKKAAKKIIRRRMLYAAGLGLIPIPMVDAAAILGTQVLMIRDLADLYDISFKEHRVKSFIGSLVGGLGTMGAVKAIPGLGTLLGAAAVSAAGVAATYAIGHVFVQHFNQGGTLLDFDPVKSQIYFQELYKEGQLKTQNLKAKPAKKAKKATTVTPQNQIAVPTTVVTTAVAQARKTAQNEAKVEALKAKRQKYQKAKQRKAFIFKWLKILIFLVLLGLFFWWLYLRSTDGYGESFTEIDLYMQENQAEVIDLKPAEALDSATVVTISRFSPISTEGVIAKYIKSPGATYPKRYALSAVRFVGNSQELSSGATEQLSNIAFLMKKYPELTVKLYGDSSDKGPIFYRQQIGRERARMLTSIFKKQGIASFRLMGNYIEKSGTSKNQYWGAEIVIDVATIESAVIVKAPKMTKQLQRQIDQNKKDIVSETPTVELKESSPSKTSSTNVISKTPPLLIPQNRITVDNALTSKQLQKKRADEQAAAQKQAEEQAAAQKQAEEQAATQKQAEEQAAAQKKADEQAAAKKKAEEEVAKKKAEEEAAKKKAEEEEEAKKKAEEKEALKRLFPTGTTESVMIQYIESATPIYPKAFGLSNVLFYGESKDLNAKTKKQLANIAQLMEKYPDMKIVLYGHTSNGGTAEMSPEDKIALIAKWKKIGKERAEAMRQVLQEYGIKRRRIKTNYRLKRNEPSEKFWGAEIEIIEK